MTKFAVFTQEGFPSGFYDEEIHGSMMRPIYGPTPEPTEDNPNPVSPVIGNEPNPDCKIPAEAIRITDGQWREFLNNNGRRKWQDGAVTVYEPPAPPTTKEQVDGERDRRTAETFKFKNRLYQLRPQDIQNISGAALAATIAIINGTQSGDLRWSDPDADFEWIATNNNTVPMDAQTVVEFANAAMAHRSRLIFKARSIKDLLSETGEALDLSDDALWSDEP